MLFNIKTHPNAKNDRFIFSDDTLEIWIKAPATEGKANKCLINYLSEILDIPKSLINISKGGQSKFKLVEINETDLKILTKLKSV